MEERSVQLQEFVLVIEDLVWHPADVINLVRPCALLGQIDLLEGRDLMSG